MKFENPNNQTDQPDKIPVTSADKNYPEIQKRKNQEEIKHKEKKKSNAKNTNNKPIESNQRSIFNFMSKNN